MPVQRVKIEQISLQQKVSAKGKPYTAAGIKINGKYYNGFGTKEMTSWAAGDTVTLDLFQEEYQGKMYDKFKAVEKVDLLEMRIVKLEQAVSKLYSVGPKPATPVDHEPPMEEPPTEDYESLPF